MSAQTIVYLFFLIIYLLILVAFNKARTKYAGGKVGEMINLIMVTTLLLFCSDYAQVLHGLFPENVLFAIQVILRAGALAFLAFGGIRIGSD